MNILGFAGSSSKDSINKRLVNYAISLFGDIDFEVLDLNDFESAVYSIDKENETGIPSKIKDFAAKIDLADLLLISLAEHNGSYSAAFKNIYDWMSRIPNRKVFNNKPLLLMATSPGGRGGVSVLSAAKERFPRDGAEIQEIFSLPRFQDNFDDKEGIIDTTKRLELVGKINAIKKNKGFISSKI